MWLRGPSRSSLRSDQGWLHKAVDVGGQLHIIEELQAFEQEPVNNVVISEKQVASAETSGTRAFLLARPLNVLSFSHICHTICLFPGERVPDLPVRRGSAPPLQLPEVRLLLRLHLRQGPSLCLEPNTVRGDHGPPEQVSVYVLAGVSG